MDAKARLLATFEQENPWIGFATLASLERQFKAWRRLRLLFKLNTKHRGLR